MDYDSGDKDAENVGWREGEWGRIRSAAMRLTFFGVEDTPCPLDLLRSFAERLKCAGSDKRSLINEIVEPSGSMHEDIVGPQFAAPEKRPFLLTCESQSPTGYGRDIVIAIKPQITMEWEDRLSTLDFESATLIDAKFVDGFCIFENGSIAYYASFVLESKDEENIPFPAPLLLVLESVWGDSAGKLANDSLDAVTLSWPGQPLRTLNDFLQLRLSDLRRDRHPGRKSVFDLLDEARESSDFHAIADLSVTLARFFEGPAIAGQNSAYTFPPVSIGIEVLGFDRHSDVVKCARDAQLRTAKADKFSKMLAGLTQNVFDFKEQDADEICDSLWANALVGSEIAFANRGVALRFSEVSRPYEQWRLRLGGSPYWLLVELIAGHNKTLLSHALSDDIELGHSIKTRAISRNDIAAKLGSARDLQEKLDRYILNVFRYETETKLYTLFSRAWDLDTQHDALRRSQQTRELAFQRDDEALKEIENRSLNWRLLAVGIIQVGGAIAGFASVQPNDRFWAWPITAAIMAAGVILAVFPAIMALRTKRRVHSSKRSLPTPRP